MVQTVLVIHNDPNQRNLLCATLKEKLAYDVTGVATGREAINCVMNASISKLDLILYDIADVQAASETIAGLNVIIKHTPVITLVDYGDYDSAATLMASGAQDFLSKPVAVERLSVTFRNAMRLRDARLEAESLRREAVIGTAALGETASQNLMLPFSWIAEDGHVRRMEQIEAEAIRFAMQYYNGRMTEVARRLGIGRSTLYRKLSEMNVRQGAALQRQKQIEAA